MSERAYLRDGTAIYERSFAIIRAEADLSRFAAAESKIAQIAPPPFNRFGSPVHAVAFRIDSRQPGEPSAEVSIELTASLIDGPIGSVRGT